MQFDEERDRDDRAGNDSAERLDNTSDGAMSRPEARQPDDRPTPAAGNGNGDGEHTVDLFDREELERFRAGWRDVQNRFVDDPQAAVHDADRLVGDVMQALASTFADRKKELEQEWQDGSAGETEDLRQALRHYRSYFNRLLST